MGIKWKSKPVSLFLLACAIGAWTLVLSCAADIYKNTEFIGSYFDSYAFENEMDNLQSMILLHHIEAKGFDQKTEEEQVGKEVYNQLQGDYRDDKEFLKTQVDDIINNKKLMYKNAQNYLDSRSAYIQYVVQDRSGSHTYTNLREVPKGWPDGTENMLRSVKLPLQNSRFGPSVPVGNANAGANLQGTVLILNNVPESNVILAEYKAHLAIQQRLKEDAFWLITLAAAAAALTFYLRKYRAEHVALTGSREWVSRTVPLEIRMIGVLVAIYALIGILSNIDGGYYASRPLIRIDQIPAFVVTAILAGYISCNIRGAWVLLRNEEMRSDQWNRGIIVRIRSALGGRSVTFKLIAFLGFAALFGFWPLIAMASHRSGAGVFFTVIYFILLLFVVFPYALREVLQLKAIIQGSEAQAAGDFSVVIPERGHGQLSRLAANMNNMKQGLRKSLEKQLVSDRLKTELITNVSHDLKTPLTSIINYVDLLKREGLTEEQIKGYVDVLDRKTERLKVLIDDLFEASKMSSGAVELQLAQVDAAALLNQALGEFGDKIEASGLTFRVNLEEPHMYAPLDGRKTWRVFENLISNALKYAMPGTRVYIQMKQTEDRVIATFLNVSAYEFPFGAEELFERFKRGDASRHTEGSGLGLAIAKSIVELQGGQLNIAIDGDQFKATVELRKS